MLMLTRELNESLLFEHVKSGTSVVLTFAGTGKSVGGRFAILDIEVHTADGTSKRSHLLAYNEDFIIDEIKTLIKLYRPTFGEPSTRDILFGIDAPISVNIVRTELANGKQKKKRN